MLVPVMHVRIAGGRLLQRLVEQLVTRAAAKAVPFVEEARTFIIDPELQLQSDQTSPRQIAFDRCHEKRAYSRGPHLRRDKDFVDLRHQAAVLEAEHENREQIPA
jgi:hypothetical protein